MIRKIGWWLDSVRALRTNVQLCREILRQYDGSPEALAALKWAEGRVGHSLLHVLLVFPVGSGRFL